MHKRNLNLQNFTKEIKEMEQKKLFKEMVNFQKTAFDNSFKAIITVQEQGEKMVTVFLTQASWLPKDGKKAITDWIDVCKKRRDDFRDVVEESFSKVQDYFVDSGSNLAVTRRHSV